MPKVSVLMPIYKTNRDYLKESIKSILDQSFKDFEFLIIDDCPIDTREDVVLSFNDSRIIYEKNTENLGISATRNKLIEKAKGEYLAIFDHDDISLPNRLEKQVSYLDLNPNVGVLGCEVQYFGKDNRLIKNPLCDHDIKLALMSYCAVIHPGSMVRRTLLIDNNIRYKEQYSPAEDYALWCDLIPYTRFYNMPEVLLNYRVHKANTSKVQQEKLKNSATALHAFNRVVNPELFYEFKERCEYTFKYRLFGCLEFLKVIKTRDKKDYLLFGLIRLLSIKLSTK